MKYNFDRQGFYREAVTSQSPGLLQPWGKWVRIINPERVARLGATALRLNRPDSVTQGSRSGNPGLWDATALR